ncbi:hypothetical protein [Flavobacterium sp.]|uniref:hypothetical protein n=1 Tax=Flavobacterium sp. TaxID=239 RepID=UPI002B4B2FB7|nr:hypothetical protein [Flavobacterium sp.]HLF52167.1 hypothetical protein [Flavobacterium sp.]
MRIIQQAFDFYINSSIHVAVAVLSLVLMTNHMFHNPMDLAMAGFAFFGTIFGYNFVKYESLFRNKKPIRKQLKAMLVLSLLSFLISVFCFFKLEFNTQIAAVVFFGLTLLYTVPFFPNKDNLRNWSGVKIYIVAFCWAGITILLPLINAGTSISTDVFLKFGQRFLLVIILILIFEIIDLKKDAPSLRTVPQKIGVKLTKVLGLSLLLPFYFLEFFKSDFNENQLWINLILIVITALFTIFANPNRSKYYTSFWVESIPVFWWLMVVLFQ